MGSRVGVQEPLQDGDSGGSVSILYECAGWQRAVGTANTYEMAPSNEPGRKPNPWPISCKNRSPSTSRSNATSAPVSEYGRFGGTSG